MEGCTVRWQERRGSLHHGCCCLVGRGTLPRRGAATPSTRPRAAPLHPRVDLLQLLHHPLQLLLLVVQLLLRHTTQEQRSGRPWPPPAPRGSTCPSQAALFCERGRATAACAPAARPTCRRCARSVSCRSRPSSRARTALCSCRYRPSRRRRPTMLPATAICAACEHRRARACGGRACTPARVPLLPWARTPHTHAPRRGVWRGLRLAARPPPAPPLPPTHTSSMSTILSGSVSRSSALKGGSFRSASRATICSPPGGPPSGPAPARTAAPLPGACRLSCAHARAAQGARVEVQADGAPGARQAARGARVGAPAGEALHLVAWNTHYRV